MIPSFTSIVLKSHQHNPLKPPPKQLQLIDLIGIIPLKFSVIPICILSDDGDLNKIFASIIVAPLILLWLCERWSIIVQVNYVKIVVAGVGEPQEFNNRHTNIVEFQCVDGITGILRALCLEMNFWNNHLQQQLNLTNSQCQGTKMPLTELHSNCVSRYSGDYY